MPCVRRSTISTISAQTVLTVNIAMRGSLAWLVRIIPQQQSPTMPPNPSRLQTIPHHPSHSFTTSFTTPLHHTSSPFISTCSLPTTLWALMIMWLEVLKYIMKMWAYLANCWAAIEAIGVALLYSCYYHTTLDNWDALVHRLYYEGPWGVWDPSEPL